MKEIKAYVHRSQVADVIAALKDSQAWGGESGDAAHNLAVYLVRGMVATSDASDRHYSTDLGDEVVNEYKLELICEEAEVDDLVRIISSSAHTGSATSGWITVASLDRAVRIP
jgi:nitrogen regulatory protein P-II 1